MKPSEALDAFRNAEQNARDRYNPILANFPDRKPVVGKHEARNHVHLEETLAEADEKCPRAADTIRWLLWHDIVDAQWGMHMVEMLQVDGEGEA